MLKLVVLSCMVAAAAAGLLAPVAPLAYSVPFAYSAPLLTPYGHNYRGPLSLAPGQPANILAADGRPLDTLDVNLDRSAHYTAKALEGGAVHLLRKRSATLVAPAPLLHAPLAYTAGPAPAYAYGARLALSPLSYTAATAAAHIPYARYW